MKKNTLQNSTNKMNKNKNDVAGEIIAWTILFLIILTFIHLI